MEIDEKEFLKYSGAKTIEELEEQVLEWMDRSGRPRNQGGYHKKFCVRQILRIFECCLYKLRNELNEEKKNGM